MFCDWLCHCKKGRSRVDSTWFLAGDRSTFLEQSLSELGTSTSELETSTSELGTSTSELETSPSEQGHHTNTNDWAINSIRAWRSQTSTLPAHGDRPKIQSQDSKDNALTC
ncbi:hypothetical protein [Scytonema sp. PCC 10023]|uniref:hypothetical protein n=1 Tax=Scytonema sp. PCC 10023 TaxID=1680591 RepID=UPI0039C65464